MNREGMKLISGADKNYTVIDRKRLQTLTDLEQPRLFGPGFWYCMHLIARLADKNVIAGNVAIGFFGMVRYAIPCVACRRSYVRRYSKAKFSVGSFQKWVVATHNEINVENGKGIKTVFEVNTVFDIILNQGVEGLSSTIYASYYYTYRQLCLVYPGYWLLLAVMATLADNELPMGSSEGYYRTVYSIIGPILVQYAPSYHLRYNYNLRQEYTLNLINVCRLIQMMGNLKIPSIVTTANKTCTLETQPLFVTFVYDTMELPFNDKHSGKKCKNSCKMK